MADVTGPRGTLNVAQGVRKTEVDPEIYSLDADAAPFTLLLARAGSKPTGNPEYKWFEDDRDDRFDAVDTSTGTGADLKVDTPSLFAEHAIWKNTRTGEVMRVQAVNAGTSTITFVRGIGASAVAAADNDELMHIGWAQPEGDTSRPSRSSNQTSLTNYTQIFRTPYEATRTWIQSETFTRPGDWGYQARKAMVEHRIDLEEAFWHGKPSENTSGSQPRRTTGGFFHYVTTNVTAMGGTMTETEFWGVMSAAFRYGNRQSKVLFASRLVTEVLNTYPRGKMEVIQADNDTTYGLSVNTFTSPFGQLKLITHNLLEGSVYGGYFAIVDLSRIGTRHFVDNIEGSSDTHVRENIQENDRDGRKDEILTEKGFEIKNQLAHAYGTGVSG